MKILTKVRADTGNCRVYVKDQKDREYVILDHGHMYESYGLPRYELHTHTRCGEPSTPLPAQHEAVNYYIEKHGAP